MLTEAYTAIDENGHWYFRRDIDSRFRIIGPNDYRREEITGIPAYVGWQVRLYDVPETLDELRRKVEEICAHDWASQGFIMAFVRMCVRRIKSEDCSHAS